MKKLNYCFVLILISVVSLYFCKVVLAKPLLQNREVVECKVHRIVPVKGIIYLIYAKNHDGRILKIISKKEQVDTCNDIRIGGSYAFDLVPRFGDTTEFVIQAGPLKGVKYRPRPHITGFDYYGVTVWLEGDSIQDLFTAKNIKGLCLIK